MFRRTKDRIRLEGKLTLILIRCGKEAYRKTYTNMIVDAGIAHIAGLIGGVAATPFTYIAVGTGTTPPSPSDTALQNEVMRVPATITMLTTTSPNDTVHYDAVFNITASYSLAEAGIFDAPSGGTMLARRTYTAISVGGGDVLKVVWDIKVG
ncbi:MAG: hypothetical protein QXT64_00090 [Desulfurococcaceae archaeon]|uniref:Terminal fiber protein n=1 Tax=Ligamenvirales sp. TaxID=2832923 RepID=A0AAU6PXA4_9VIRU